MYAAYAMRMMMPSLRVKVLSVMEKTSSACVVASSGMSRLMRSRWMVSVRAVMLLMPMMSRMLAMLLPMMLSAARVACPWRTDTSDVTSSGSDVPTATMVMPMRNSLMPSFRARSLLVSMNLLADFARMMIDVRNASIHSMVSMVWCGGCLFYIVFCLFVV